MSQDVAVNDSVGVSAMRLLSFFQFVFGRGGNCRSNHAHVLVLLLLAK